MSKNLTTFDDQEVLKKAAEKYAKTIKKLAEDAAKSRNRKKSEESDLIDENISHYTDYESNSNFSNHDNEIEERKEANKVAPSNKPNIVKEEGYLAAYEKKQNASTAKNTKPFKLSVGRDKKINYKGSDGF